MNLSGRRLLVVGGSAGIGREVGLAARRSGADVAFAARRMDRLDEIVAAAGGHAVGLDVRDEAAVIAGVAAAVEALGGLDGVVYASGLARLTRLREQDAGEWREVLETNLVGAALVAREAADHLAATQGVMLVCSSTTDEQPRWGLSSYAVSKAALNRLATALRSEHPGVRFVRATIGATTGTEFGAAFDPDVLTEAFRQWMALGQHNAANYMDAADLADVMVSLIAMLFDHPAVDMPSVTLEPPVG